MLSPPKQLWKEIQRPQDEYQHKLTKTLPQIVANHFNTYHTAFTTKDHICVGVHCKSILFMLQLAVNTYNRCKTTSQSKLKLKSISHTADTTHVDQTSSATSCEQHTICVQHCTCPITKEDVLTHTQQRVVLVFDVPHVLTEQKWSCAFAVFPHVQQHSESQTEWTSVRRICNEIQKEIGTIPTSNIQTSASLVFTPWVLSFVWKHSIFVRGIELYFISQCQEQFEQKQTMHLVDTCTHTHKHSDEQHAFHFQIRCSTEEETERIQYLIQECSNLMKTKSKQNKILIEIDYKSFKVKNEQDCMQLLNLLPVLPASPVLSVNEHKDVHTEWIPTSSFIEKWFPKLNTCIGVLKEVLS